MVRSALFVSLVLVLGSARGQTASAAQRLGPRVVGHVTNDQRAPAVTVSSGVAFAAWEDLRDDRASHLYGTHLAASAPTDVPSLALVRSAGNQTSPAIAAASDGTMLLVYVDDSLSPCGPEVAAQRLDANGARLGSALRLSTGRCHAGRPAVAWGPTGWLVTWGNHGSLGQLHGALVALDGTVTVPDLVLSSAATHAQGPAAIASSTGFFVAWEDDRTSTGAPTLYLLSLSANAQPGVETAIPGISGSTQRGAALARNGSTCLVTWIEHASTDYSVRALAIDANGTLGSTQAIKGGTTVLSSAVAVGIPAGWFIVYDDQRSTRGLFGVTFSTAGALSTEVIASSGPSQSAPALAVVGSTVQVVFQGDSADYVNGLEVLSTTIDASGDPPLEGKANVALSSSVTRARHVGAAWNGGTYLASWRDDGLSFAGSDVRAQRLAPGTGAVDPDGGLRVTTDSAILSSYPSIGGAPDAGFFLSYGDFGSGSLLEGAPLGATGAPVLPFQRLNDTTNFVAEHETVWFAGSWATIFKPEFAATFSLRRTTPAGQVAQAEQVLFTRAGLENTIHAAAAGSTLLTVSTANGDVLGARWLDGVGQLDAAPFVITHVASSQTTPCVASDGADFLVAWVDKSSADWNVWSARVDADGGLGTRALLSTGTGVDSMPALAWTGREYLAAWVRGTDVVGARVSAQGQVLDATPFVLSASVDTQLNPYLVAGPPGEVLLTYEAFDPSPSLEGITAQARLIVFTYDAGVPDAGLDAGAPDAGFDAGPADAQDDAGLDAGLDAGFDAGLAPGGVDAGVVDAGAQLDAGQPDGNPRTFRVGCSQTGDLSSLALLLLLGLKRRR